MAGEPLLSWKKKSPATAEEQATADLIRQAGEPKALSPEAYTRIHRRLRDREKERLPLFADMRLALISGGVASIAIVAALSFTMLEKRSAGARAVGTQVARESAKGSDRLEPPADALALSAPPPAPDMIQSPRPEDRLSKEHFAAGKQDRMPAKKAEGSLSSGHGATAPAGGAGFGGRGPDAFADQRFAQPPPNQLSEPLAEKRMAPAHAKRAPSADADDAINPFGGDAPQRERSDNELALRDLGGQGLAPNGAAAPSASPPSPSTSPSPSVARSASQAAAPAKPASNAAKLDEADKNEELSGATREVVDLCLSKFPLPATKDDPGTERALFSRGKCHLQSGKRSQGLAELNGYLAWFPSGQFADEAKRLVADHTP